jgi:hypothetical protein
MKALGPLAVLVLLGAACSQHGGGRSAMTIDGSPTDAAEQGADIDAAAIDGSDGGGLLTGGQGPSGLFVAHRSSVTAAFDLPIPLKTLDPSPPSYVNDFDPTTLTGLTLYFTSDRAEFFGSNSKDLWVASRTSTANDFDPPVELPAPMNTPSDDATPFLSADGSELWFSSDRPGGLGKHDIYRAAKTGSSFAAPELVVGVSSSEDDYTPTLSADGLVIFFSSSRADGGALGEQDVWTASRARVTDPFSNAYDVTVLNSSSQDYAGWLSADGCRLYLSSTRPGAGGEDIYVE